jgi:hypothetical protein
MEALEIILIAKEGVNTSECRAQRQRHTYITPDRCTYYGVVGPNNSVHKLVEAGKGRPEHIETGASIPRLHVPWKWYQGKYKAEESEYWVEGISHVRVAGHSE